MKLRTSACEPTCNSWWNSCENSYFCSSTQLSIHSTSKSKWSDDDATTEHKSEHRKSMKINSKKSFSSRFSFYSLIKPPTYSVFKSQTLEQRNICAISISAKSFSEKCLLELSSPLFLLSDIYFYFILFLYIFCVAHIHFAFRMHKEKSCSCFAFASLCSASCYWWALL